MKNLFALILLIVSIVTTTYAQNDGLKKLDFFIGEWSLTTKDLTPSGAIISGKARTKAYYILDKAAIQDDFYMLGQNDQVVFRGTSIRSFNRQSGKYQIVWVMPGVDGIIDISGVLSNGKLVTTGKGYDGRGEFLERFEYYDIKPDSYSFKMDRSYDGGKTWLLNFSSFDTKRIN